MYRPDSVTLERDKAASPQQKETGALRAALQKRGPIAALVLADVLVAGVVWMLAYLLVLGLGSGVALDLLFIQSVVPSVAVWIVMRGILGLYPGYGYDSVERLRRHFYSVLATVSIIAVLFLGFGVESSISRLMVVIAFVGILLLPPVSRKLTMLLLYAAGLWGRRVIVVSYQDTGIEFVEMLRKEWGLGFNPVALFDSDLVPAGSDFEETAYAKTVSSVIAFSQRNGVDTAIFATPYTRREQLEKMVRQASESLRYVLVIPNLGGVTNSAVKARDLAGTFAVEVKHNLLDPWARRLKRAIDLFGAGLGGLAISPLLVAIAVMIKIESKGNVLYGHRRLGPGNQHFYCLKFRTMHADADSVLEEYLAKDPALREEWERNHKLRDDPRVTKVGRILRKTSLDELPQLWNVLVGEMSLIGPRPIVDDEIPRYKDGYELYRRIRPGMSGFWQVSGRSDTDYDERVGMDTYYVRNWSVWLDVVILIRTVSIVLKGRGAY